MVLWRKLVGSITFSATSLFSYTFRFCWEQYPANCPLPAISLGITSSWGWVVLFVPSRHKILHPAFVSSEFGNTRTGEDDVRRAQPREQITLCARNVARDGMIRIEGESLQFDKGWTAGYSRDPVRAGQPGTCRSRAPRDGRHTSWASVKP